MRICQHMDDDQRTTVRSFTNQHGEYGICRLCEKRWKVVDGQWQDWEQAGKVVLQPSSSASQPSSAIRPRPKHSSRPAVSSTQAHSAAPLESHPAEADAQMSDWQIEDDGRG